MNMLDKNNFSINKLFDWIRARKKSALTFCKTEIASTSLTCISNADLLKESLIFAHLFTFLQLIEFSKNKSPRMWEHLILISYILTFII